MCVSTCKYFNIILITPAKNKPGGISNSQHFLGLVILNILYSFIIFILQVNPFSGTSTIMTITTTYIAQTLVVKHAFQEKVWPGQVSVVILCYMDHFLGNSRKPCIFFVVVFKRPECLWAQYFTLTTGTCYM